MVDLLKRVVLLVAAISTWSWPAKTTVMYTNGVLNSRSQAVKSLFQIAKLTASIQAPGSADSFEYVLGYNTGGGASDLLEASRQLVSYQVGNILTYGLRFLKGRDTSPTQAYANLMKASEIRKSMRGSLEQKDLDSMGVKFVTAINDGKRFIHITHSQGGLFANALYEDIPEHLRPFYNAMEIATPAQDMPPGFQYLTFNEDAVIAATRVTLLSMSGNIQYSPDVRLDLPPPWANPSLFDYFYHPLWVYLDHPRAQAQIVSKLKWIISNMGYPSFQHPPNWNTPEEAVGLQGLGMSNDGSLPGGIYSTYSARIASIEWNPFYPFNAYNPNSDAITERFALIDFATWDYGPPFDLHLTSTPPAYSLPRTLIAPTTMPVIAGATPKSLYNALGLRKTRDVAAQFGVPYIIQCADSTITWFMLTGRSGSDAASLYELNASVDPLKRAYWESVIPRRP